MRNRNVLSQFDINQIKLNPRMLKDKELHLLHGLSQDDEGAFAELYSCCWEDVFNYVVKILKDQCDAEDVVQETFLEIWKLRENLSHIHTLKGYLIVIARNKAFKIIHKSENNDQFTDAILAFADCRNNNPNDLFIAKELSGLIDREVVNLPPKMRKVFVLSRHENRSYKEISAELNLSDKTVKKQINNSIKFLRKRLKYHYYIQLLYLFLYFSTT